METCVPRHVVKCKSAFINCSRVTSCSSVNVRSCVLFFFLDFLFSLFVNIVANPRTIKFLIFILKYLTYFPPFCRIFWRLFRNNVRGHYLGYSISATPSKFACVSVSWVLFAGLRVCIFQCVCAPHLSMCNGKFHQSIERVGVNFGKAKSCPDLNL